MQQRLVTWGCDVQSQMERGNKADGFGLGGSYCIVFVMLLCAELFRGVGGPGNMKNPEPGCKNKK